MGRTPGTARGLRWMKVLENAERVVTPCWDHDYVIDELELAMTRSYRHVQTDQTAALRPDNSAKRCEDLHLNGGECCQELVGYSMNIEQSYFLMEVKLKGPQLFDELNTFHAGEGSVEQ